MTKENFLKLVDRVRQGSASDQDIRLYHIWFSKFQSLSEWNDAELGNADELKSVIEHRINEQIDTRLPDKITRRLWTRFAAAASIVMCISFGGYYFLHKHQSEQTAYYKNDILPGHNQATLTLANGKKIILIKGLSGTLAQQGNTLIGVNGQSAIAYTAAGTNANLSVSYNTLSTAVGEQSPYPLLLADGTKVWLNAQSSITFPTAFNGKERIVRITGEALFEVAHNADHPFKVQTEKQTIEDIGTTFNVNAYVDEPTTKTTLIEGKVKVNGMFLEPGQQSDGSHINAVNTRRYTAWRNGDFYFENDNIQTVMRQLSRWYNIEINYEGDITTNKFYAQISRSKNISAILHILENTKGVHFKIEGRRVTVIE
ncbi:FecR family protein [Mucilaginibacter sp. X5P1]|uniref:FecR family protein n=1 Tax=Mucilaginibacter sp. X5P1 TaxID=2723088 RepID=UPI00160BB433|nr:FecR family protein [Mucilaginibacter sp. X5P1]MBB6137565.1 ferric-dicitrate binding protein FerR (iron transport regulator) [Mucilaginibacter sp. X5P1]